MLCRTTNILYSNYQDVVRKTKYIHDERGYTIRLNTINVAIGRVRYLDS